MNDSPSLFRHRHAHQHSKVTFIELFFDLVFVFAITQLSHLLIAHFSAHGAIETLLLMLAVWWVWIFTSWVTNWLDPDRLPVRMALLVLMTLGLILSSSIPKAFTGRGLAFAGAYATMQVGRSLFFIWAARGHPQRLRNFQRITIWLAVSAVFWILGAFAHDNARLALWAVALTIEFIGPWAFFWVPGLGRSRTVDWDVEGAHLAERCALFIIIALGESILVTGATFSDLEWSPAVVGAFIASLVGSFAMWWLYFDTAAEVGSHRISHSDDPGRIARLAYTYIHLFMVAGIIVAAVSDEFVLHHPSGHSDGKTIITVLGSAGLYLMGNMLFKWVIIGRLPLSHLIGIVVLGVVSPIAHHMTPVLLSASTTAILVVVAMAEYRVCKTALPEITGS